MAIEPESSTERKKLADVLDMMKRQDPTFRARENEETGQTLISGMGELHLEVIKHRLLRDYKLNVRVHKPRVSYRESIQKAVEVTGECHRAMSGADALRAADDSHGAEPSRGRADRRAVARSGRATAAGIPQRGDGSPRRVRQRRRHVGLSPFAREDDPARRPDARDANRPSWPSAMPRPTPSTRASARRASCFWSRS